MKNFRAAASCIHGGERRVRRVPALVLAGEAPRFAEPVKARRGAALPEASP